MKMKLIYKICLIVAFHALFFNAFAQPESNWDQEKIIAKRYPRETKLEGSVFLIDDWADATVTLKSGEILKNLPVKYNGYEDQLISYNELYYTLIEVEKETVSSFEFDYMGSNYYFELRNFGNNEKKDPRFFQVYYDGQVDVLCYRRVALVGSSIYYDMSGIRRNQKYQTGYRYFLFNEEGGYHPVSLNRRSLLRYVSKDQKRQVKRLLRQNNVLIRTPEGYARAVSILEDNEIKINL